MMVASPGRGDAKEDCDGQREVGESGTDVKVSVILLRRREYVVWFLETIEDAT